MELTELLDRFRGPLIGLIGSWGATPADAAEIAQDSFADAYLNRHACRGDWTQPEVFGRWLRGIARNNYRNALRSQRRREKRVTSVDTSVLESASASPTSTEQERLQQLRLAIDSLPAKLRQAVMMHYIETTTVKDVAAMLSVSPKTIEARLYRARGELRRVLGETTDNSLRRVMLI